MKKLFYHGTILTLEPELYAQAVLVAHDRIVRVGDFEALRADAPDAQLIDLGGSTMLPAFVDAHGHFSSYANAQLQVSLEESATFAEIAARLAAFIQTHSIPAGQWIVAKGYDHNTLAEHCHPTRALLDQIAPHNPLVLQHQSGHCGVLNTRALALLGVTADTPAPAGGVIGRAEGGLTGYLEEGAYFRCIQQVPQPGAQALLTAYAKAQKNYLSYGITTVQEGMMVAQMLPMYQSLLESGLLTVDVVGYADMASMHTLAAAFPGALKHYDRHFKLAGYKIILDGSPQVKTAWMKTPYQGSTADFGYGTMCDADVAAAVAQAEEAGLQILAHCNGDAAIQQYLDAVAQVTAGGGALASLRPVIIHAQLMAEPQLAQAAALHVIPSFFMAHVRHWGDIHIQNFGYDRAQSISPAGSALRSGLPFTFHQDAPVIEPNMLETVQCAVTRTTKAGVVLGPQERIGVLDALKAVTLHAAYQYHEEESKGSIRVGKQADFVILSENPLAVPCDKIADIRVLETIKSGELVFHREE